MSILNCLLLWHEMFINIYLFYQRHHLDHHLNCHSLIHNQNHHLAHQVNHTPVLKYKVNTILIFIIAVSATLFILCTPYFKVFTLPLYWLISCWIKNFHNRYLVIIPCISSTCFIILQHNYISIQSFFKRAEEKFMSEFQLC